MKRILIFSGTTEGRKLAEAIANTGMNVLVCVATEYGEQVMDGSLPGIELHAGRMSCREMQMLMEEESFLAVIDATHPFATEVSKNIRQSAAEKGLDYFRLKRDTKSLSGDMADIEFFSTNEECAKALLGTEGNILLTTGSKELAVYCEKEDLKRRIYARILPSEESMLLCKEQGLSGKQIIAMQGPFSEELNQALIRQYDIRVLVSKESGVIGGFEEKVMAVRQTGIRMYVIRNPEREEGLSFDEISDYFEKLTGKVLKKPMEEKTLKVSLIGTGMGDEKSITVGARKLIRQADYIFGAKRLLSGLSDWDIDLNGKELYPYYLAENIIPRLEELWQEGHREAVVLFSGDSGFYSGAQTLYQKLMEWKTTQGQDVMIRVYPGISSVSYFSSACGLAWQDVKLISIHGKEGREEWESELLHTVRHHAKVMVLTSGVSDVREVGRLLYDSGLHECRIITGYQLSYPDERIMERSPSECAQTEKAGLYILLILNETCEKKYLAPCKNDESFIRGTVPMTKEEIRELSICKLQLKEAAVVYDIGSGTGSLAVEIAERSETIRVYAVEQKKEAVGLIRQNRSKFHLPNIEIIHGKAPECLADLPVPTHAFIGGTGGKLREILQVLYQKNPAMRIVVTAVSLETVGELTAMLKNFSVTESNIIQVQVSRAKEMGNYHLMQAENPVYICSFDFREQ